MTRGRVYWIDRFQIVQEQPGEQSGEQSEKHLVEKYEEQIGWHSLWTTANQQFAE